MSDPVLDAHVQAPLWYAISAPVPISIRDQILRGTILVERLIERGFIGPTRPLVVIGAGAGGASAAIKAAQSGVHTHLVEAQPFGFATQRLATTRAIDPTQYDWPVEHCTAGRLPWGRHPALPLAFHRGLASHLSIAWNRQLRRAQLALRGLLRVHYNAWARTPVLVTGSLPILSVPIQDPNGIITIPAGAVVDAKGFGSEDCRLMQGGIPSYEGQPFWGPDGFGSLDPQQHTVLISGSGDGALQDYLRVVTGARHAGQTYTVPVPRYALDILSGLQIPQDELLTILGAEEASLRGRSWACDDHPTLRIAHEGPYFRDLETAYQPVINRLLRQGPVLAGLRALIPVRPIEVHVVYRETYLTCYYGLNRFLTLLISGFIEQEYRLRTLYPGVQVDTISASGGGHRCVQRRNGALRAAGTYSNGLLVSHTCFGQDHDVVFTRASGAPSKAAVPSRSTYNVVIVRHGLVHPPKPPLTRTRHMLPYAHP